LISAIPCTIFFYRPLIEQLKKAKADVGVASSDMPELYDLRDHFGCTIFPVEISRQITPLKDLVAIVRLWTHLRRKGYDIVHAHTPKGGLVGMVSAYLARVPHRVYTVHGLVLETAAGLKRRLLWAAELMSCKLATKVVAVSPSLRKRVLEEKLCPEEKVQVLGDGSACGIDLRRFKLSAATAALGEQTRGQLNIPTDATVIGFVGRIVPDKGIETLVNSFVRLQQQVPKAFLLLIGRLETMRDCLNHHTMYTINTDDRIHCMGHVKNVVPYYAAMDILVLPSRREGFGLSLVEAGALGLPVIATKVTGCVDAVVHNVTGLLVDVDNDQQLAEAMLKLLTDAELRRRFGEQGRQRVEAMFDSKLLIDKHIAFYKELIGKAPER